MCHVPLWHLVLYKEPLSVCFRPPVKHLPAQARTGPAPERAVLEASANHAVGLQKPLSTGMDLGKEIYGGAGPDGTLLTPQACDYTFQSLVWG